jgi:hypothetical protein
VADFCRVTIRLWRAPHLHINRFTVAPNITLPPSTVRKLITPNPILISLVNFCTVPYRFDADPDPAFHFDADPNLDPDPALHSDANPDPEPGLT